MKEVSFITTFLPFSLIGYSLSMFDTTSDKEKYNFFEPLSQLIEFARQTHACCEEMIWFTTFVEKNILEVMNDESHQFNFEQYLSIFFDYPEINFPKWPTQVVSLNTNENTTLFYFAHFCHFPQDIVKHDPLSLLDYFFQKLLLFSDLFIEKIITTFNTYFPNLWMTLFGKQLLSPNYPTFHKLTFLLKQRNHQMILEHCFSILIHFLPSIEFLHKKAIFSLLFDYFPTFRIKSQILYLHEIFDMFESHQLDQIFWTVILKN
jgi:hypothetical protein